MPINTPEKPIISNPETGEADGSFYAEQQAPPPVPRDFSTERELKEHADRVSEIVKPIAPTPEAHTEAGVSLPAAIPEKDRPKALGDLLVSGKAPSGRSVTAKGGAHEVLEAMANLIEQPKQ